MPEINSIIKKLFKENETASVDKFYEYINRIKIIVFVPHKVVEMVAAEMSNAGAGRIGNYDMCSFRTEGTGTFKPNVRAKPLLGKKNFLSKVEEVKLEMECDPGRTNEVIDAMLKHHPYEETAYEIYNFKKRSKEETGLIVNLRSKMKIVDLFGRMNKNISNEEMKMKNAFKKIAITNFAVRETMIESAKYTGCEYVISISNNKYKLIKIY